LIDVYIQELLEREAKLKLAKVYEGAISAVSKNYESGLVIAEVLESDNLPIGAPRDYVYLCDWLEEDLKTRLESVPIGPFIFTEPSSRDGECLSVRIAFKWSPHNQPLDFGNLCWWQVTEVGPFKEFYPYQEPEKLFLNLRDCT